MVLAFGLSSKLPIKTAADNRFRDIVSCESSAGILF